MLTHIVKLSKRLASENYKIFERGDEVYRCNEPAVRNGSGNAIIQEGPEQDAPIRKAGFQVSPHESSNTCRTWLVAYCTLASLGRWLSAVC